jgi:hypothetical protein
VQTNIDYANETGGITETFIEAKGCDREWDFGKNEESKAKFDFF